MQTLQLDRHTLIDTYIHTYIHTYVRTYMTTQYIYTALWPSSTQMLDIQVVTKEWREKCHTLLNRELACWKEVVHNHLVCSVGSHWLHHKQNRNHAACYHHEQWTNNTKSKQFHNQIDWHTTCQYFTAACHVLGHGGLSTVENVDS